MTVACRQAHVYRRGMVSGPSPSAALLLLTALISTAPADASARMPDTAFPCHVAADKPEIGFDLRFHAGYRVIAPVRLWRTPEAL